MRNPIKFSSPKLDIYNSTYDFSNLVQKSVKEITETLNCSHWHQGPTGQRGPPVSKLKQSMAVGRRYLANGEHSGETNYTIVIYTPTRIY